MYYWISVVLLWIVPVSSFSKEEEKTFFKSFSAELVEYNKHNQRFQKKVYIKIGSNGLRMMEVAANGRPAFISIQNFKNGQQWFVAPKKMYYTTLPMKEPSLQTENESKEEEDDGVPIQGVLNTKPCLGMQKQKLSERALKGSLLTVWKCTLASDNQTYLQHYSSLLGVVVRQETSDGRITELRNVVLTSFKASEFEPSNLWREVTLEEFFTGVPSLPDYIEPSSRAQQ